MYLYDPANKDCCCCYFVADLPVNFSVFKTVNDIFFGVRLGNKPKLQWTSYLFNARKKKDTLRYQVAV